MLAGDGGLTTTNYSNVIFATTNRVISENVPLCTERGRILQIKVDDDLVVKLDLQLNAFQHNDLPIDAGNVEIVQHRNEMNFCEESKPHRS